MSIWEFYVAQAGYINAHTPDDPGSLSAAEQDELWQWMLEKE